MFINLHTHKTGNGMAIVNQYPDVFNADGFFSIGIHPWRIDVDKTDEQLDFIKSKSADANCLAIGECGLDKKIGTALEIQQKIFERQIDLAENIGKPLIIHCVSAYDEVIRSLKDFPNPVIIHGFSKNAQVAKRLTEAGFYLSFGKWLIQNPELASVFSTVPMDRIFLETDSSDFTIESIYEKASVVYPMEELQQQIQQNFKQVFGSDKIEKYGKMA